MPYGSQYPVSGSPMQSAIATALARYGQGPRVPPSLSWGQPPQLGTASVSTLPPMIQPQVQYGSPAAAAISSTMQKYGVPQGVGQVQSQTPAMQNALRTASVSTLPMGLTPQSNMTAVDSAILTAKSKYGVPDFGRMPMSQAAPANNGVQAPAVGAFSGPDNTWNRFGDPLLSYLGQFSRERAPDGMTATDPQTGQQQSLDPGIPWAVNPQDPGYGATVRQLIGLPNTLQAGRRVPGVAGNPSPGQLQQRQAASRADVVSSIDEAYNNPTPEAVQQAQAFMDRVDSDRNRRLQARFPGMRADEAIRREAGPGVNADLSNEFSYGGKYDMLLNPKNYGPNGEWLTPDDMIGERGRFYNERFANRQAASLPDGSGSRAMLNRSQNGVVSGDGWQNKMSVGPDGQIRHSVTSTSEDKLSREETLNRQLARRRGLRDAMTGEVKPENMTPMQMRAARQASFQSDRINAARARSLGTNLYGMIAGQPARRSASDESPRPEPMFRGDTAASRSPEIAQQNAVDIAPMVQEAITNPTQDGLGDAATKIGQAYHAGQISRQQRDDFMLEIDNAFEKSGLKKGSRMPMKYKMDKPYPFL